MSLSGAGRVLASESVKAIARRLVCELVKYLNGFRTGSKGIPCDCHVAPNPQCSGRLRAITNNRIKKKTYEVLETS